MQNDININGVPFIDLLLKVMDASDLSPLINGMYKTVKDSFSFSIFQEIFDLAGIESTVYLLNLEQLIAIQPVPSVVYLSEQKCFAILKKIQENQITLLTQINKTLTLDKLEFQKTWDGMLLPVEYGSFSEIYVAKRITNNDQFDKNHELKITVIPQRSDSKSIPIRIGQLSTSAFTKEAYFCFEAVIPACDRLRLLINSNNKISKTEDIVCQYDIPVSLDSSINILRFHFAKNNGQDGFNIIGLRGSTNQIFKANEK